jgi:hypothetical protein
MTIKPSHTRQGKRRHGAAWSVVTQNPEPLPAKTEARLGIERAEGRRKPPLPPMTSQQEAVLAVLADEPQRQADIARVAGVSPGTAYSSLDALQRRDLAVRVGGRWRRGPA